MSAGARYLVGTALIALAAMAAGTVLPRAWGPGWWLALGIALVVQAPLGWWLMTSIGTERFLPVFAHHAKAGSKSKGGSSSKKK